MPLYMDVHEGVDVGYEDVVEAHRKDCETQKGTDVEYKRYWFNEKTGNGYCLFKAPSAEEGDKIHREAHGLTADEIVEVADDKRLINLLLTELDNDPHTDW